MREIQIPKADSGQRNHVIDIVRALCMLSIILAHTNPPETLNHIRNFDVVTLVIISGMCMKEVGSVRAYFDMLFKRVKRLLVPTYLVIAVIFVGTAVVCGIAGVQYPYSLKQIAGTVLLLDGIGYIWVSRVFFLISVLSPLLFKFAKSGKWVVFGVGSVLCILCQVLHRHMPGNQFAYYIAYFGILYTVAYSVLAAWGIYLRGANTKKMIGICLPMAAIYLLYRLGISRLYGEPFWSTTKHPPMLDWFAYGMICTAIIYVAANLLDRSGILRPWQYAAIKWLSVNSFGIYFAHVLIIKGIELIGVVTNREIKIHWFVYFLLLTVGSIAMLLLKQSIHSVRRRLREAKKS